MNDAAVIATLPQAEGILIQHPGQDQRPAQTGEVLRVGDVVTNTQDAPVSVQLVDGPPLLLSPQMQALVTIEWANSTRPSVDEASTDDVDPLVEAILAGADFEAELEATAAGPGATPEGEGHSFVRLERIQESVDQSDLSGVGTLQSGNSDDLGQANQAEVPDAVDDIISTPEDTPVVIDVLGNDSDPDGSPLTIVAVSAPGNGTATISPTGTSITYTPAPNSTGTDSFTYTIQDSSGNTDTATVTVNVTDVNDAPLAQPDQRLVNEDGAGVSGNVISAPQTGEQADTDPDGDSLSVVAVGFGGVAGSVGSVIAGSYGDLVVASDGSYTYVPNAAAQALDDGDTVSDVFSYTVSDGALTDTTTLSFNVTGSNDGPIAQDDLGSTPEDQPLTLAILGNDSDPDGDALSVVAINGSAISAGDSIAIANGSVTLNAGGTVTVTPAPNYNGPLSFEYTISDGDATDTATVTVNVIGVNDGPVALPDERSLSEDTTAISGNVITAPQAGEQADIDPDGDALSVVAISFGSTSGALGSVLAGNYGDLILSDDGSYTYQPNAAAQALSEGEVVRDVFAYTVSDGTATDTTTLSFSVAGSNDGPIARDDLGNTPEDTPITLAILGNDSDPEGDPLSVVTIAGNSVSPGDTVSITNGSVTFNTDSTVTVTPAPNFSGTLSFTYSITDGDQSDSATVTVNINDVNDAPNALADSRTTTEDGPTLSGNVITAPQTGEQADSDPDGDALNVSAVAFGGTAGTVGSALAGDYGTLTLNADGSYSYTPNAAAQALDDGDSVSEVFSYTVSDGSSTDTTTLTITVTGSNDGPVAVNDSDSTPEDTPVTLAILGNDSDPDGDALSVVEIAGTAVTAGDSVAITNGSVTLNANGTVTVTPTPNYNGTLSFEYTISDGDATDTATVTVNVSGVNDSPTAQPDVRSVGEDGPALSGNVITAPETGERADSDPDGDALNVSAVAFGGTAGTVGSALAGDYGSLTLNSDGSYSYTPNAAAQALDDGDSVSDVFSYTVSDGSSTDTTTLTITVTGSNDGPVAVNDSDSTPEDTPVTLAILGNDSDPDGDALSVVEIAGTAVTAGDSVAIANGSVTLNANGTVTVTPATNYNGTLSFEYTISDGDAADTATVTVNVSGVNDSPTAQPDVRSVGEDGPALSGNVITAPEAGEQADTDPDGDALNVSAVAFGGVTGTVGSALAGDYGTLTLNADGSYSYTPNAAAQALDDGDSVTDVFSYTLSDGASTDTTTLTITVTGSNDGPVAVNDSDSTPEDSPVILAILGNDTDPDGDTLSVVEIAGSAVSAGDSVAIPNGSVTLNANGTVTVTPAPNYNGTLSFEYTISDGDTTDTATVTVNVSGVNDSPTAQPDVRSVSEDGPALSGNVITAPETGEQADTDPDGDALNVTVVAFGGVTGAVGSALAGDYGTLTLNADGSYSYTPNAAAQALDDGDSVSDVFSYTVSDGSSTDTTTLTITVTGSNDGPVAVNDSDSTPEDTPVTLAILGNDSDPDGDALSVVEIAGTAVTAGDSVAIANGSVTLNANGTVTVTPAPNYNGTLSFEYTISDGDATDTATVTVNVSGVNDGPNAQADVRSVSEDGPALSGNVITAPEAGEQADTDPDGDALNVSAVAFGGMTGTVGSALAGDYGTLTLNADGSYSYTPNAAAQALDDGDSVTDVFSYTLSDGASTDTTTLTITVTGSNDGPVAVNDSDSTPEDTPITLAILGNDSDPDGDALSVVEIAGTAVTAGDSVSIANGSVTLNANGTVTVTPATNYNGTLSFEYTISDGDATDTATVTVNVSGVNDGPTALSDSRSTTEDGPTLSGNVITAPEAGEQADTDPDGDALNVSAVAFGATSGIVGSALAGDYGTLTLNSDGSYSYTPNAAAQALDDGDSVSDVFSYTVSDGSSTDTTTLTITVTGSNDGPVAVNDSDSTPEDTPVTLAILGNDSDPDGDALGVVEIAGTAVTAGDSVAIANGSVTLNANGTVTVTPATNYNGTLSFEYTISDGDATDTATVTVNVSGVNDAPSLSGATAAVSEEGLAGGIPDTTGNPSDTSNNTQVTGQLTVGDADGDPVGLSLVSPSTSLTSGGETLSWQGDNTQTLVATAGGEEIARLSIDNDGNYQFDLLRPLDHPDSTSEDVLSIDFGVVASDGQDSTTATLQINVEDDAPSADSIDQSVEFLDTNLLVVLDVSGSMGTNDGIGGQTRLASAISAINSLMSRYAEFGDVAVRIVAFSGSAQAVGSSWTSIAQAQSDLSSLSAGGQTNYDAALDTAQTAFASNGALSNAQNIAYFFSDGQPTRPSGSRGINASEEADWVDFLNTEFISAYAMGLGDNVNQSNLNPIAHNGESGENRDAVIVNSLADLEQTLEDTVANTTRGNLLSSGELQLLAGADGAHLSEISIDGTTYRYDIGTNSVLVSGGLDRSSFDAGASQITITTLSGGELELNFVSGDYTFVPTTGDASMPATVFTYFALDNDGDSAGGQVSILAPTVQITEGTNQANTLTGADTPDRLLGGDGPDTLAGGGGDDQLFGGNGNDTLLGELGNDILFGHGGDDELLGGLGKDQLQGGTGNDTLTGGGGSDTFIWRFSDADGGVDVITDWTSAATDAGGDRLDLRDLLQGEQGQDLSDYLHFETNGSDTTIRVSSDGDFSGGYSSSAVDHSIQLQGIDLTQGGSLSDTGIIQDLLNRGQLIVD